MLHTKGEVEGQRRQIKHLNGKLQDLEYKFSKNIDRTEELALLVKQNEELREALDEIEREKIAGIFFFFSWHSEVLLKTNQVS